MSYNWYMAITVDGSIKLNHHLCCFERTVSTVAPPSPPNKAPGGRSFASVASAACHGARRIAVELWERLRGGTWGGLVAVWKTTGNVALRARKMNLMLDICGFQHSQVWILILDCWVNHQNSVFCNRNCGLQNWWQIQDLLGWAETLWCPPW